jgi:hypothetical protein
MVLATMDRDIFAELDRMRIDYPPMTEAHELFDDLRFLARKCSGHSVPWGGVFGPPLIGKTTSVTDYIETKVVDELIVRGEFADDGDRREIARCQRTVVHVTTFPQSTQRSFTIDILEALGDSRSSRGVSTQELLARVCECLRLRDTELLIIDDAQHLFDQTTSRAPPRRTEATVTDTLKTLLLKGVTAVVLLGTLEARYQLMDNVGLAARCIKTLDFSDLDKADGVRRAIFVDFVGRLGLRLKQYGLIEEPSDFLSEDVVACMREVTKGRVGVVAAMIRSAYMVARETGAGWVTRKHLSAATDIWAIPVGMINYNPFEDGIRSPAGVPNTQLLGTARRRFRRSNLLGGGERRWGPLETLGGQPSIEEAP